MYRSGYWPRLRAPAATLLAAACLVAVGPTDPAAAERRPDRDIARCASRACVLILDGRYDRDGDGVTDADEEYFGTDPADPSSVPPAVKMIDELIARKLPSFERHITELVLLPTKTPDGTGIATGLGEFQLRDGDGDLLKSIGIVIEDLGRNGFDAVFGLRMSGVRAPDATPTYPFDQPRIARHVDTAWYSNGTTSGMTSYGANAGKEVQDTTMGSGDRPYLKFLKGGVTRVEEVHYTDGSKDVLSTTATRDDGVSQVDRQVTSYDKDGNQTGSASASGKMWTDTADGTKHTVVEYDRPIKDDQGKEVGTEHTKIHMEEKPDGSTKITTETTKNYSDGTRETKETVTECKSDCADADDDYQDPEYIGFDIVTPQDWARLATRIKYISQPVPDDGDTGGPTPEPPTSGQCWPNCGGDSTLILMDPDGVVVIAADAEPNFNSLLFPDYVPWIDELEQETGQPVPATSGT